MATIYITTQILDGNLGNGWSDNHAAAQCLAEFTADVWRAECMEYLEKMGYDVNVNVKIDVERNTSGCSRDLCVSVKGLDFEAACELENQVKISLTDKNQVWEWFCASEEATRYFDE
jgi:hypothetical protein